MYNCLRSGIAWRVAAQQRPNANLGGRERLANAVPCRAADHVVAIERCLKRDRRKKILFEFRSELFQLVQSQVVQLATLVQAIPDSVANLLVCFTKGNALVYKI